MSSRFSKYLKALLTPGGRSSTFQKILTKCAAQLNDKVSTCQAHVWLGSVAIWIQDQVVWEGEVEVFYLTDSTKASRVYAWAHEIDIVDEPRRTVAVLHIPPVTSPEKAVRASIVRDYREREEKH